jgi:hypothetical protein
MDARCFVQCGLPLSISPWSEIAVWSLFEWIEIAARELVCSSLYNRKKKSMSQAEVVTAPVTRSRPRRIPTLYKIWPVAVLGFAMIVTGTWITFLGFGFYKLIF